MIGIYKSDVLIKVESYLGLDQHYLYSSWVSSRIVYNLFLYSKTEWAKKENNSFLHSMAEWAKENINTRSYSSFSHNHPKILLDKWCNKSFLSHKSLLPMSNKDTLPIKLYPAQSFVLFYLSPKMFFACLFFSYVES